MLSSRVRAALGAAGSLAVIALAVVPASAQTPSPKQPAMAPAIVPPAITKSMAPKNMPKTMCGADPSAYSIRYHIVDLGAKRVDVIGTIKNVGTQGQSPAVVGHQFAYLYAIGMSHISATTPIAQVPVPQMTAPGQTVIVHHVFTYPFTLGDVATQFRLTFAGDPDIGTHTNEFDCNRDNDTLLFDADQRPFYPAGSTTYTP
jgi:hypothetical protein